MQKPYRSIHIIVKVFKTISYLCLFLLAVGMVGIIMAGNPQEVPFKTFLFQIFLNLIVPYTLIALMFYGFGASIQLLLILEERTRA